MTAMPSGHYDRYDPTENYDQHLFRAGRVLQSAELNEIQSRATDRLTGVANALFRDGAIIRDCIVVIDQDDGVTACSSGAVYLRGAVRGVPAGTITIPLVGTVAIGIRLVETVVTEVQDPTLLDPAVGVRNYGQPGAARLKIDPVWAWDGDGGAGAFYPIYTVDDGVLRPKEPPPQIDGLAQAIARYDRDSAGGTYVVRGTEVHKLPDVGANQVYSIAAGSVRVMGRALDFTTSRRINFNAAPDLRFVNNEPHVSTTAAAQRVNTNLAPISNITEVLITAEKTVSVVHGAFVGAQDVLPDATIVSLQSVVQGGTTYVEGTSYQLTAGKVDWSLAGAEPATGSTYNVTYRYITAVTPTAVDLTGFTVTGAVAGTALFVSYNQMVPRIDRICVTEDGQIVFIKGVAASYRPLPPEVPENVLKLATINQTWDAERLVLNDGVRTIPMNEIADIRSGLDRVFMLVAQQRLESSMHTRESGSLKGIFTDPFLDDTMRDAGQAQTGAIFDGILTLPIDPHVAYCDNRPAGSASSLQFTLGATIQQLARTGSMKINPYLSLDPIKATVVLQPSIDRFVTNEEVWTSSDTAIITRVGENIQTRIAAIRNGGGQLSETVTTTSEAAENLRTIEVVFVLANFGNGETLSSVKFDGITVVPSAI